MPFAVLLQKQTGVIERAAVADGGEHIEDLAFELRRHVHAIGGK